MLLLLANLTVQDEEARVEYLNRFNRKGPGGSRAEGGLAGYVKQVIPEDFWTDNQPDQKWKTTWKKNDLIDFIIAYVTQEIEANPGIMMTSTSMTTRSLTADDCTDSSSGGELLSFTTT
jgi:hypothetical protein